MKYFRQDLLARFGSRDDAIALSAQEELETQSEEYAKHLHRIRDKLPVRLREFQEQYYLHDARVLMAWPPDSPTEQYGLPWNGLINWGAGVKVLYTPFASITLELDTPPKELLVLNYRQTRITGWAPFELGGERTPYLEWGHDEIEILEGRNSLEAMHSILFCNGIEWHISGSQCSRLEEWQADDPARASTAQGRCKANAHSDSLRFAPLLGSAHFFQRSSAIFTSLPTAGVSGRLESPSSSSRASEVPICSRTRMARSCCT